MKHIIKGSEPEKLIDYKETANDNWKPSFSDLRGEEKQAVHNSLIREQGGLCCYCEDSVTPEKSHIEHFRPQSDPLVDDLDYGNMLCSCQRKVNNLEPKHCGNAKGNWFDDNLLISPLDPGCEQRFAYAADGSIRPTNPHDEAAKTTIERLKLDCDKLRRGRKNAVDGILAATSTDAEIKKSLSSHLGPDSNGTFGRFYTTVTYLFRDLLGDDHIN